MERFASQVMIVSKFMLAALLLASCGGQGAAGASALGGGVATTPVSLDSSDTGVDTLSIKGTTPVVGAMQGSTCRTRTNGGTWMPGQDLCITFPAAVGDWNYSIQPSAPSEQVPAMNSDPRTIQLQFNRISGINYQVQIKQINVGGTTVNGPLVSLKTPTAADLAQLQAKPRRAVTGYLGTLVHDATAPFGILDSLDAPYPINQTKLNLLISQGVQIARTEISPFFVNPQKGVFDFSKFDPVVDVLQSHGIQSYVEIRASVVQAWGNNHSTQPSPLYANPADYAAFCSAVAGHLVSKYPAVTKVSISDNEPNMIGNWDNQAGAALFGSAAYNDYTGPGEALYMRPCYAAIKAVAPKLQVFAPEMAFGGSPDAIPFLENLYASGCRVGTCFDGLSMHLSPYNDMSYPTSRCFFQGAGWTGRCYEDAQQVAVAHGDPKPPVILSETGYSTDPSIPQGFDEAGQAYLMSRELATLENDPSVEGVYWSYIDGNGTTPGTLFGDFTTVHPDGSPKLSYSVFKAFSQGLGCIP